MWSCVFAHVSMLQNVHLDTDTCSRHVCAETTPLCALAPAGDTPSTFSLKKQVMFTAGIAFLVGVDPKYVRIVKIASWTARRLDRRLQTTEGGVIATTEVSGEHLKQACLDKNQEHANIQWSLLPGLPVNARH